jgi:ribosome-associated protein
MRPGPGDVRPLELPLDELDIRASRSSGPGGQHVNRSSTRVEVRWNPGASRALTEPERTRILIKLAGRLDQEGWIRVVASDTRSQARNKEAAIERLVSLVERALAVPKARKKTRVPRAAKERRLESKRQRSRLKRGRGAIGDDEA